jgi:ParB-like chromosome segregation protein Spo0J
MADTNITDTPIGELKAHPDNPRQGDISAIAGSIQKNGWYGTIVAQRSTGYVLAGNHRLMAAKSIGMETVPVYWVDVDDEQANRILLADNRASDLATYDDSALADILANLVDTDLGLTGTGFDDADLEALLFDLDRLNPTYGTLTDDIRTVGEAADAIEASGIRSVIIPFQIEQYNLVVARLAELRTKYGVDSNAEVMLKLVEK